MTSDRRLSPETTHTDREDGAVAVVVALFFAAVVLGLAALTIDLGGLWSTQRALVIDSDAMALAGAQRLAEFPDCVEGDGTIQGALEQTVLDYARENGQEAPLLDDGIVEYRCADTGRGGVVTVGITEFSPGYFSGDDNLSARQTTSAEYVLEVDFGESEPEDPLPVVSKLAFCQNLLPDSGRIDAGSGQVWMPYSSPPGPDDPTPGDPSWFPWEGSSAAGVSVCPLDGSVTGSPAVPGGWRWLVDEISGGDTCAADDGHLPWDPDALGAIVPGDPGNNCMNPTWDVPRDREFLFPIFDEGWGQGSSDPDGVNATGGGRWRIVGWGRAVLIGCSGTGGGAGWPSSPPTPQNCSGNPTWINMDVLEVRIGEDVADGNEGTRFELTDERTLAVCSVDDTTGQCSN